MIAPRSPHLAHHLILSIGRVMLAPMHCRTCSDQPTNLPPQHTHLSTAAKRIRASDISGSLAAPPCFTMTHWSPSLPRGRSSALGSASEEEACKSGMRCSFRYCVLHIPQNFAVPGVCIARKDNAQRAVDLSAVIQAEVVCHLPN